MEVTLVENNKTLIVSHKMLYHFECPICTELLYDRISICTMGHSACDFCTKQTQNCTICGSLFQGGRNYALEGLLNYISVRCAYERDGCPEQMSTKYYKDHLKTCIYRERRCFASIVDGDFSCSWVGKLENMVEHFNECHEDLIMDDNKALCSWDFYNNRFGVNLVNGEYFLIRACLRNGSNEMLCFSMIPARSIQLNNNNSAMDKSPRRVSSFWKLDFNYFQLQHGCFQNGDFLDDENEIENASNYKICLTETNFQSEFFTGLVKFRVEVFKPKKVEFFISANE